MSQARFGLSNFTVVPSTKLDRAGSTNLSGKHQTSVLSDTEFFASVARGRFIPECGRICGIH